jgi:hypothetical protein
MGDRWQDFCIFLVIFIHCAYCFHRVLAGHSEVVEEKDGEVLCMLNLKSPSPNALHINITHYVLAPPICTAVNVK